ncbi:hypothetical protein [Thermococcus sp.]
MIIIEHNKCIKVLYLGGDTMKFYICREKEEPKEWKIAIIGAGPA